MPDTLKLLCVDDDEDTLFVTLLSLQLDEDIAASSAQGPAIAMAILQDTSRYFDGLLLDMRMPGMNGVEMLRTVRTLPRYAETPVIFLTASVLEVDLARYRELGGLGPIAKPYNPLTIAAEVKGLIGQYRAARGADRISLRPTGARGEA